MSHPRTTMPGRIPIITLSKLPDYGQVMIIVAGGDSFVWGSELSDHRHGGSQGYSRLTFPALLAKDTGYICAAYPGYSNEEISQGVYRVLSEDKRIPFIFVCWTWPSRDKHYKSSG